MKTYYIFEANQTNETYLNTQVSPVSNCPLVSRMKLNSISNVVNPVTGQYNKLYRNVYVFEHDTAMDSLQVDMGKVAYSSQEPTQILTWLNSL
jgi:hypothetical protein